MRILSPNLFRIFVALPGVLWLTSCASVSVKEVAQLKKSPPSHVPEQVFVAPFTYSEDAIRVDRSGADLAEFQFQLSELMTRSLVRRLPKYVGPATAVAKNAPLPRGNYWLIRGNFDRVYQGSRLLRSVIGLGSGATLMETTVEVYDLSGRKPVRFLRIVTTGGSNISPGVLGVATFFVSGPMALTSLFNVVDGIRSGVTFDTIRTSREVNAALSEYLGQRGAIPSKKAIRPKRLGKFPPNPIGLPDTAEPSKPANAHPAGE